MKCKGCADTGKKIHEEFDVHKKLKVSVKKCEKCNIASIEGEVFSLAQEVEILSNRVAEVTRLQKENDILRAGVNALNQAGKAFADYENDMNKLKHSGGNLSVHTKRKESWY